MESTLSLHAYYLSPAYLLIIVILTGFIYHLIRNQEYKNTLLSSTIIGIIFTLLLVPVDDLIGLFLQMGMFVALVIFGGFLAVGFKKLRIMNETVISMNLLKINQKVMGNFGMVKAPEIKPLPFVVLHY